MYTELPSTRLIYTARLPSRSRSLLVMLAITVDPLRELSLHGPLRPEACGPQDHLLLPLTFRSFTAL